MILPHVSIELRSWLAVGALLCAVYAYAMFRADNCHVCADCGCAQWDDHAVCSTCHDCGRVRG